MDYVVVNIIKRSKHNTRYLVEDPAGEYYSIKVSSDTYTIGEKFSTEKTLEPAKQQWIDTYNSLENSYPRKRMLKHLIDYKEIVLKDQSQGTHKSNRYPHIFDSQEKNLIKGKGYDEALDVWMNSLGDELRDDFSYMTSSQAFAVNFFTPLIVEERLDLLADCFQGLVFDENRFEKVMEPKDEKTQFDFYASGNDISNSFSVEVKYSENEFGYAVEDARHLDKFSRIYREYMIELTCVDEKEWQFFEYYQVWRNLIYTIINKGQHICFLFPAFRNDLKKVLDSIISKCKEKYKPYFHVIIADNVVNKIIASDSNMKPYYEAFKQKYLNI